MRPERVKNIKAVKTTKNITKNPDTFIMPEIVLNPEKLEKGQKEDKYPKSCVWQVSPF